jgi:hypothetical protein
LPDNRDQQHTIGLPLVSHQHPKEK